MPQKPKFRLGRPKRRRASTAHADEQCDAALGTEDLAASADEYEEVKTSRKYADDRILLYAQLAWAPDYKEIFRFEAEINGSLDSVEDYASGYRKRQMRAGVEGVAEDSAMRISEDRERLERERNVHYVPFSQAMKGVNFLIDQVPTHTWRVERKAKRVVGRAYATKLLWQMLECRPPPSTPENEFFQMFVYDQTYATAGGGHGVGSNSHNGVGRFDAEGKRIRVQREVYINAFDVHIGMASALRPS